MRSRPAWRRRSIAAEGCTWPVAGGDLSQGYHYGHYGIDIAADSGTAVKAAGSGKVTFAGWKNNGGGYQVWIAHGPGCTPQPHVVAHGRHRPERRPGAAGGTRRDDRLRDEAHLHFEVWRGPIWMAASASTRWATSGHDPRRSSVPGACRGVGRRGTMAAMFLDRVKINVRAGDGGDGARRSGARRTSRAAAQPAATVVAQWLRLSRGRSRRDHLRDFQYRHHFKATHGGRGERAPPRLGEPDLVIGVPPGTAVLDDASGELLADLVAAGQQVMVARGGRSGLGNTHFKTSTHQAPKHAQKGEPGTERWVRLELRLIADVGLVGLPNAGKSTLLAAVTAATPKIADYPFTTLEPNLGVMDLGEDDERRPTIADVPGLIEGASSGAGLGHAFLRHVERTRARPRGRRLVARPRVGPRRHPRRARGARPALLEKPMLVAFNKIDLPAAADAWQAFRAARARDGLEVVAISASTGEGLDVFRERLGALLPPAEELDAPPEPAGVVVHRIEATSDGFAVEAES